MIRLCLRETAEFWGEVVSIDKNVINIAKNVKFWGFLSLPLCTLPSAILQSSHYDHSETGINLFQKPISVNVFNLGLRELKMGIFFFPQGKE